jgi:hypothetical protein
MPTTRQDGGEQLPAQPPSSARRREEDGVFEPPCVSLNLLPARRRRAVSIDVAYGVRRHASPSPESTNHQVGYLVRSRAGEPSMERLGLFFSLGKSTAVDPGDPRTARDRRAVSVHSLRLDNDTIDRHALSLRSLDNQSQRRANVAATLEYAGMFPCRSCCRCFVLSCSPVPPARSSPRCQRRRVVVDGPYLYTERQGRQQGVGEEANGPAADVRSGLDLLAAGRRRRRRFQKHASANDNDNDDESHRTNETPKGGEGGQYDRQRQSKAASAETPRSTTDTRGPVFEASKRGEWWSTVTRTKEARRRRH